MRRLGNKDPQHQTDCSELNILISCNNSEVNPHNFLDET